MHSQRITWNNRVEYYVLRERSMQQHATAFHVAGKTNHSLHCYLTLDGHHFVDLFDLMSSGENKYCDCSEWVFLILSTYTMGGSVVVKCLLSR